MATASKPSKPPLAPLIRLTVAEVSQASQNLTPLYQALMESPEAQVEVRAGQTRTTLSPATKAGLITLLEKMVEGGEFFLISNQAEVSTQQAAALLGASRPFIVSLIKSGALPSRMVGTHRRLLANDVISYRETSRVKSLNHPPSLTK